jgi:hypothetical protein
MLKSYGGLEGQLLVFLMEVRGQLHVSVALPKGNNSRYPLDRGLDGPQNLFRLCAERKVAFLCRELIPQSLARELSLKVRRLASDLT